MYSKVTIAGHPIHPMLVGFPVTLYTVSLACYVAAALGAEPFWFRVAVYANVAGIVLAAIAAVPGFVDWAWGVPARSAAKRTGLAHMACNVGALIVFAINAGLEWPNRFDMVPVVGLAVVLSALGVLLTIVAGFVGWRMVQTYHVGVDLTPEQERLESRLGVPVEVHDSFHGHGQPVR